MKPAPSVGLSELARQGHAAALDAAMSTASRAVLDPRRQLPRLPSSGDRAIDDAKFQGVSISDAASFASRLPLRAAARFERASVENAVFEGVSNRCEFQRHRICRQHWLVMCPHAGPSMHAARIAMFLRGKP